MDFKTNKTIGISLLLGSVLLLIPYTLLVVNFNYPDVLRENTGVILTEFHNGGSSLIFTWLAFALVGLPLIRAVVLIGQKYEAKLYFMRWATTLGVIGLVVQMIGLLRWVFVVPVLAETYVDGDDTTKAAAEVSFKVVHQFGGVLLGEHIGQLFTIAWTIMVCYAIIKLKVFSKFLAYFGILASLIYLLAQLELITTVIPNFLNIAWAGFVGSTLWLLFLIMLGFNYLNKSEDNEPRTFL